MSDAVTGVMVVSVVELIVKLVIYTFCQSRADSWNLGQVLDTRALYFPQSAKVPQQAATSFLSDSFYLLQR